ncbi:hypothetical protein FACS189490_07770 [Clostridia bacterium]|nr:hypothetical protein FACS189490_07770 [Clostridia bacterium]
MICGYDLIFFWVIRMVFSSLHNTGELPFYDVLTHGLIRDENGVKFSKSLDNGVDPLEVIEKYGADALRFTLVTDNSPGNDMRFVPKRLDASRNFLNKIWNAARFLLMNFEDETEEVPLSALTRADKWIISRLNSLTKEYDYLMGAFDFGAAVSKVHEFVWDEFCDWYIEMVKPRLYNRDDDTRKAALWTLNLVFTDALKLLHPFMPFITEEIFLSLQDKEETIMFSPFPEYREYRDFPEEEKGIGAVKEAIKAIRAIRTDMNVPGTKKVSLLIVCEKDDWKDVFTQGEPFLKTLGFASDITVTITNTAKDTDISVIAPGAVIYMPFAELVDIEKETARLTKEVDRLTKEAERAKGKLSNKSFTDKAPGTVIAEEREKLAKYEDMLKKAAEQLGKLRNAGE